MDINHLEIWILRLAAIVLLIMEIARFIDYEVRLLLKGHHGDVARSELEVKAREQERSDDPTHLSKQKMTSS